MTGADVVNRAYEMVGDVGGTKRNTTAEIVVFLNDAVRDLIARRPYMRLNTDATLDDDYTDLTAANYAASTLPFEDWVREPLAHYIAHRIFQLDAEDEANLRQSVNHQAQYMRMT